MFKKKRFLLGMMALGLSMSTLASCSAFFVSDTEYMIESYTRSTDADGNITITFYFTDEEIDPLVVTIPAGLAGEDGVSIADISYTQDDDGNIIITITYSDGRDATVVTIPTLNGTDGEDGVSITGVQFDYDDDGNTVLVFSYSDGSTSPAITIYKGADGKDGADGTFIASITTELDEDGNTIVYIYYSDETSSQFTIPKGEDGQDGENGSGIAYTYYTTNSDYYDNEHSPDDYYCLVIVYENGSENSVYLPKAFGTVWYHGGGAPSSSTGREGDYYIDVLTGYVYQKSSSGTWSVVFQLNIVTEGTESTTTYYYVMFYPNGGTFADTVSVYGEYHAEMVAEGRTLALASFPEVAREDSYSNFLGWYTSSDYTNVNSGQFTDTTPVSANISLYARWADDEGKIASAAS